MGEEHACFLISHRKLHGNYTENYTEITQELKPAETCYITWNGLKKSRMLVRRRKRNWRRLLRRKRGTRLLSYFSQKITRELHGKLHGIKQKVKPAETILLTFLFPTFTAAGFVRSFNLQIEGKTKNSRPCGMRGILLLLHDINRL